SVPAYAECAGPLIEWDDKVIFSAVQHPGEADGATTTNVASTFPYRGNTQPRPAIIMVWPQANKRRKGAGARGKGATGKGPKGTGATSNGRGTGGPDAA